MRRYGFLLRLAVLNTFKRKFRAGLAIGGIALSSAVMVLLFGVSGGLKSLVTQELSNSDTANVVTVNIRNAKQVALDQEKVSAIRSISGVGDVQQLVGMVGTMQFHGTSVNLPLYAISNDFFKTSPVQKVSGTVLGEPQGSNVVLSTKALETLGMNTQGSIKRTVSIQTTIPDTYAADNKSEEERTIKPANFTVAGSIDRGTLPVAYIPLEYVMQRGLKSVSQLKVTVTYPEKIASVRESIEQMGLQTTSLQDSIDQVNRIFSVIQQVILLFGFIALAITVFATFNVITLTLMEETRQIGFLRLMGLQKNAVKFLFTAQAIMLTFVGAFIGTIFGVLTGFVVNGVAQTVVGDTAFTGEVYIFKIPALQIIIILMLSIVLGWLVGLMPSKRAVLMGPLEELKE